MLMYAAYRFDIAWWRRLVATGDRDLATFLKPVLEFISDVLERGESVLVHCLAGAHRAGTTAIICLMHFQGLNSTDAIKAAKTRRPIIEPIGDFRELLSQCDLLRRNSQSRFLL